MKSVISTLLIVAKVVKILLIAFLTISAVNVLLMGDFNDGDSIYILGVCVTLIIITVIAHKLPDWLRKKWPQEVMAAEQLGKKPRKLPNWFAVLMILIACVSLYYAIN